MLEFSLNKKIIFVDARRVYKVQEKEDMSQGAVIFFDHGECQVVDDELRDVVKEIEDAKRMIEFRTSPSPWTYGHQHPWRKDCCPPPYGYGARC